MVTKPKSPNYPGVDLGTAIDLAVQLYRGDIGRGEFTPIDAAKGWNYKSASGPVRVRIAALRQYGLIEGKRGPRPDNPKLSHRALTFAIRPQGSREYQDALREAALTPPLFGELHQSHPNAADGVLVGYLVMDKNFTDDGAQRFIAAYRSTLRLAGLDKDDTISGLEEDESLYEGEDDMNPDPDTEREFPVSTRVPPSQTSLSEDHTRVPLRLIGGSLVAAVELPSAMTETAWQQMMTMLEALKPGYVTTVEKNQPSREP
ncbi:MAG: hypothetical protein F4X72_12505 [Dehalococcoidia bacterium]|nr:hypothetical protein [Dehalococcoidia bacterium]